MSELTQPRLPWAGAPARRPSTGSGGGPTETRARPWAWRLGSIAGIDLYIHATFLILLAWVAGLHLALGQGVVGAARGLALILAVFGTVVIHELSHALTAKRFGIRTRDIILLPIGGVASLERLPEKPREELLVTLAGPATNLVIAVLLAGAILLTGGSLAPERMEVARGPFLPTLMWVNVSLTIFNLLPAFPMDGGRVLRALLSMRMDHVRATAVAARIGQGMALLFGLFGLMVNPLLVVIALFVWIAARQESSMVQLSSALHGIPVRSAMISEFKVVSPEEPVARAAELLVAGFQHEFPVISGDRLVGILGRADIVRGITQGGPETRIERVMQRDFAMADPSETLELALGRIRERPNAPIVVVRDGRVMGLLTAENIGELVMLQGAARRG